MSLLHVGGLYGGAITPDIDDHKNTVISACQPVELMMAMEKGRERERGRER